MQKYKLFFLALISMIYLLPGSAVNAQVWDSPIRPLSPFGTGARLGSVVNRLLVVNGYPAMVAFSGNGELVYIRATNASGTAWGDPVEIARHGDIGKFPSACIVNGNPAISYYDNSNGDLYYVRANDANGITWGTPVNLSSSTGSDVGMWTSLCVVNGNPAIAYYNSSVGDLYYIRASDANGATWNAAVNLSSSTTNDMGKYASMCIVNGNPAIAYYDATIGDLYYVRASNASGTTWNTPVNLSSTNSNDVGQYSTLYVVNGNPAIAFFDNTDNDLYYIRASNTNGTAWNSRVAVTTNGGQYNSMCIVNGNPAISYYDLISLDLHYVRAGDANGTTWGTPVAAIATSNDVGLYTSLYVINGNPAIAYYNNTSKNLNYVRATDINGATWGSSLAFDIGAFTGANPSLKIVNGTPAMSYYAGISHDLYYVRAKDASGISWNDPVPADTTGSVGYYSSLCTVNSNPAIAYFNATTNDLYYIRANDASGSSWGTRVAVDTTNHKGTYNSMFVVNGKPAIAYYDETNDDLYYVQANDASGTSWGTPVNLSSSTSNAMGFSSINLGVVNGYPAISYYDGTAKDLYYIRASDANGTAWNTPVAVATTNDVGYYNSLCVVNGKPAISYRDRTTSRMYYVQASDSNGAVWNTPVLVATTNVADYTSLCVVNGHPAISNFGTNIGVYYVRASDSNGAVWGARTLLDPNTGSFNSYVPMVTDGANIFIAYEENGFANILHGTLNSWTAGASTTNWFTPGNWSMAAVPTATDDIAIPAGLSYYPDISSGTASCRSISIVSGASTLVSGGTLQVAGGIVNNGTFNTTGGTVILNGSSQQGIRAGIANIKNLTLNNSSGAVINSGMVNVTGIYTPTSGILTTGGYLTLKSTASGTGAIAAGSISGGYISGPVNIERYIPAKRAFRFLAHPFSSAIELNQLTDNIDITGTGGIANGFTPTNQNNPSAFTFDVTTGDNSTTGNNPGWSAFTSTTNTTWAQYQGARIMVRGAKGEGLNYPNVPYTPSAVTLDMTGAMNQGDKTVNLAPGTNTAFVMVGNPFPSQVSMDSLSGSNVGSSFYIWDATAGIRGAYTTYSFGTSGFNLPSCGSFVTTMTATGSILFEEQDKTSATAGTMFKTTAAGSYMVQLRLEDSTTFWDRLLLKFDDNAMATVDYPDAAKLYNPDMTFYTWSQDDSMLAIDARPYVENEVILLGLYSTLQKSFKIVATDFNMPAGTKLFLHDKYLNKVEEITPGYEYWFTVTADTASWGNERFELNTKGKPTAIASVIQSNLTMKLVPNPTTDMVTVYCSGLNDKPAIVTLTNLLGAEVAKQQMQQGSAAISMKNMANGIYIVTVHYNSQTITGKVIKQ